MFRLILRNSPVVGKNSAKLIPKNVSILGPVRTLKYNPIETTNKIEVGHKMTQVIDKYRQNYLQKKTENEKFSNLGVTNNRRILIACSNPNFNHYTGQAYKNFSERNLASYGWQNRRSAGQYFTINSIGSHPSLIDSNKMRNERGEMIEFEDLNVNKNLVNLVKQNLDIHQPTIIQFKSINEILRRESHHLITAETGGGKTLTYALPSIECSIAVKKYLNEIKIKRSLNQPICVILVPTRELAFQVYNMFQKILQFEDSELNTPEDKTYLDSLRDLNIIIDLHKAQILAKEHITGQKINSLNEEPSKPIDILITLPGQLEDRLKHKSFNSAYLRQIILDEADTLLDDSFSQTTLKCLSSFNVSLELPEVKRVIKEEPSNFQDYEDELQEFHRQRYETSLEFEAKLKDPSAQLLFVSATIPRDMKNILENLIDCDKELKTINTNKTNRLMLHVPQKFIRTNGTQRPSQLLEIIQKELNKKNTERTLMVFTHKTKTAIYVHNYLKENNIDCDILIKKLNNRQREEVVNNFFNRKCRVLVCTDIASRGWDTLHVNHVINFEMPQYIADYLHRVGRVGRLNGHKHGGSGGLVTNFIINRFEVDLVWNIEKSLRLGVELHNVNANIKRLYKYSYLNEKEAEEYHRDQKEDAINLNKSEINISDKGDSVKENDFEYDQEQNINDQMDKVGRSRRRKPFA